jgi:peptidylprolyl isomerase
MVVFDIELISFADSPTKPPADVNRPPKTAKRTASELFYKTIKAGAGEQHPKASNQVTVHYSGWTTDGNLFDSSIPRGQPATFALSGVIAGWTEGLQLMVEGEKARFWIPEYLAYKGLSEPYGMLVFDIELIKIR